MGPQWMRKFGVNLCRFYTLFLLFEEGQSLNASALVSCATTKYLRWVPSWTRALEMSGFSGCAASELILLSDSSEMVLSLDDGSGSVQLFQQRCEPVVLTLVSPLSICGYRFQTAAGSDLQDPLGFALHGSMDGSNWLILHEEPNYNTTRSRSTTSDLFEIYVQNISLEEVSVQMIVFSTSAARAWAHEGPFLAAEYAIEEFQLLAAGAILDLYDAAVEVGPNFTIKRWGTTTSTSSTSTISSSSISSTSISSTSISTTSGTTTSTSTRTNTSSTTATFTSSSVTHSTSRSSTSTVSDTTSSWLSSTSTWPSSTSTFSTTSSATGTSSSSSTVSSSSSSSTTSTSTSTSSSSSSTSTSISTSTSATTSLTSTSRTYWTWTSRTWTWTGFSTTRTWVTWTWTSRTMTSTSTRTTSTTTTSSVSTTSTSTSSTSTSSTSTSSMSTSSTSTSSPSTTSTSTSWTSTSSTSSTTTSSTTSTVPSTSTRVTSTSSSATRTTGTASTSSTTSSTASTITMTSSITRSTSTSTISTTTRSITTSISSSTLTTTSSTPKRGLGSSYLRVDLGSPVMLQAFRFITSSGSIERDPVQFAVWGSADNVSWIPLYFQNDISAVPTTRSTPTAWYAISTTTTTSTTTTSTTTITVTTTTSSSSTSSSVLPFDEALQNALGNLEASKLSFLGLLDGLNTNSSTGVLAQRVDVQEDGTVLVGVAIAVPEDGSPVAFGYGNISVEVPSAILESLGAPGVAVMGLLPTTSPLFNLLNSSEGGMQSDILSLDLFANGTAMKDLVEPIQLTLVSDGSQPATCAYLDEQTKKWSTEGVSLVSVQNGTIICATSHLSIFGAILKSAFAALACSNAAAIFSEKGLRSLGSRLWIFEWSAILNWITLLLGASLMARARKADRKHQGAVEQIQLISALRHVDRLEKSRDVKGHHHDSIQALILDEVRFLFDTGPIRIAYSRMLRARLGLSLQELNKLYKHAGHTSVHKRAECFLREFENRHIGKRISFWYRMNCIWFSIFHPSPKTTCLVRTSVLLGKIYSGWALSAVFYGASSIAPGEEDGCTPVEGLLDQLVRAFTVSLISSAFGALPFVALVFFFYRLRKLRLSIRRAIFWSFLFCYTFLCVGVVCIFIASVSPSDATKWFYTSLIDLLMTWLLPVLVSAAVLMIMSFYWFESAKTSKRVGHEEASHPVLPWPSLESLQMYEVKMGSLEVLEYKVKKKKPFRVTCEVAGCPDTSQSFERMQDEGSYRVSQGVFTASEDNQLLFSVYHWKGKTPPKLRGRALIPVAHLLDDGFNGKLDVQLDGHSVPMNVQVFFHKPKRPQVPASALVLPSEWNMSMTATEDTDPHAVPVVQEEKVELPHAAEPPEAAEASQPAEPAEVADSVLVAVEEERLLGAENVVEVTVTVVEASAQPEVQVDEDYEELSVPSEPPPLCARGNLLARARTVTEELITVDVDAELFDPKEEVAELSQPRRESAASQPRSFYPEAPELYQRGGTTPSVSFSEEIEVEVEQEVPRRDFGYPPPSVPRLSPLSSPLSTSRRSAGPSRVEIVEKVEDPGLRDLCSIAEQRRLTSLPTARGQAT